MDRVSRQGEIEGGGGIILPLAMETPKMPIIAMYDLYK
jgi:hypothetical protein